MTRYKVLKIGRSFIELEKEDGTSKQVKRTCFDSLPDVGDIVVVKEYETRYDLERNLFQPRPQNTDFRNIKIDIENFSIYFKNLSFKGKLLYTLIAIVVVRLITSFIFNSFSGRTEEAENFNPNNYPSYSKIAYTSSENSYNSLSSTAASSSQEEWAPTSQVDVNKYLNIPQTRIILRGKILQEISYKLYDGSRIYEVETEVMGIFEPDTYREYALPGERLFIRTTHDLSPYINQVMIYTGNTISQQSYGTVGKGAISIEEFRKTAQAQEAEQASKEASKYQAEVQRASVTQQQTPSTSSSTVSTSTPVQTPSAPSSAATAPAPSQTPHTNLRPFSNCSEARAAGRVNIPDDDPQYGPWLDRDMDGIGCER